MTQQPDRMPRNGAVGFDRPLSGAVLSIAVHGALLAAFSLTLATQDRSETPAPPLEVTVLFESAGPTPPTARDMAAAVASLARLAAPPAAVPATALLLSVAPPQTLFTEGAAPPVSVAQPPQLSTLSSPTLFSAKTPSPARSAASQTAAPQVSPPKLPKASSTAPPSQRSAGAAAEVAELSESSPGRAAPEAPAPSPLAPPHPAAPALIVTEPDYRSPPAKPVYPRRAIDLGLEGEVLVRAQIDEIGDPVEPAVWRSSGHPILDRAALDAVRRWRFKPALRNGRAVAAIVQVPVSFRLQ